MEKNVSVQDLCECPVQFQRHMILFITEFTVLVESEFRGVYFKFGF